MCKIMYFYFNPQFCEKVEVLINALNNLPFPSELIMQKIQTSSSLQFCKKYFLCHLVLNCNLLTQSVTLKISFPNIAIYLLHFWQHSQQEIEDWKYLNIISKNDCLEFYQVFSH